jgi:hypothetical protein
MSPFLRMRGELRWTQVAIDLFLIVVGILAALAVDDAIQQRRDARAERQYLELLARDLDRDLETLAEFIDYEERQTAAGIFAYRALRAGVAPADREAVAQSITQLLSRRTLRLARSTYTDLLSTGNIRLLRNARLRDDLARLHERNERALAIRDRNNQVFVDEMFFTHVLETGLVAPRTRTNLPTTMYPVTEFGGRVGVPVTEVQDRLWTLGPDSAEWTILANKIWYRSFVSFSAIGQAKTMVADTAAVRKAIADELARK